jgi:hypothetical protein
MGIRGELFSTTVLLQNRTYFFNVKENRLGDLYLNIVESKNKETGGFDRQSVILFAEDLKEFLSGFDESLRVLEKAVREQKRNAAGPRTKGSQPGRFERGEGSLGEGSRGDGKPGRGEGRPGRSEDGRPRKKSYSKEGGPKGGLRPMGAKDRPKDGPRGKDGQRPKDGPRRGGKMVVRKKTRD